MMTLAVEEDEKKVQVQHGGVRKPESSVPEGVIIIATKMTMIIIIIIIIIINNNNSFVERTSSETMTCCQ